MSDIKAKIRQTNRIAGQTKKQNEIIAQTVTLNAGNLTLSDLGNVNTSGQTDGAMMIYNGTTGQYDITPNIENENLNINGGTY